MNKKGRWKPIAVILAVIGALVYVGPTFFPDAFPQGWKKLNYGLDLKGGLELRYAVDYKRAIGDNTWKVANLFRDRIIADHLGKSEDPDSVTPDELASLRAKIELEKVDYKSVRFKFADDVKDAADKVDDTFIEKIDRNFMRGEKGDGSVVILLKYEEGERLKREIIDQTMDIIRKRIDAFGLVEPDVRRAGDADIDVQLPGVEKSKMELVRAMIGQTAQLNFRLIEKKGDPLSGVGGDVEAWKKLPHDGPVTIELVTGDNRFGTPQSYLKAQHKSELIQFVRYVNEQKVSNKQPPLVDDDHMFGFEAIEKPVQGSTKVNVEGWRTHYVIRNMKVGVGTGKERAVTIGGERLTRAQVQYDQNGAPYASLDFDGQGAKDFGDLTTDNVDEFLSIMLDDEVKSAPRIEEPITGGRARVTLGAGSGVDKVREAQALVTVLTHGAYKAPVHKVHDHNVGPSLGKASINQGVLALAFGALLVVLFMVGYYKMSGAVACVALVVNILWIIAALVSFNAALTLPGLAGIVLTVGMAVDANVLIFERVREELRAGKSVRAAIDAGYGKAFWTIFDSNLTTALAGFVLLEFATGPVYGFAVTLLIGIASTMFTMIVITRMIFDWLIQKKNMQTLSI